MAFAGGALYPCRFALVLYLLSKILPVAIHTIPVVALQRVGLQTWPVFTADIAGKALDDLRFGRLFRIWPKPGSFEYLLRAIHIRLDQSFLVPPEVSKQDCCGFRW